jgi:hypothetical protein
MAVRANTKGICGFASPWKGGKALAHADVTEPQFGAKVRRPRRLRTGAQVGGSGVVLLPPEVTVGGQGFCLSLPVVSEAARTGQ